MYNILRNLDCLTAGIFRFCLHQGDRHSPAGLDKVKDILCVKLWGLGNLVVIYPLLFRLKERFPQARITFITLDGNKCFLEAHPAVDKVIGFPLTINPLRIIVRVREVLAVMKAERPDIVLNFETFNNASAVFSYMTGASIRVGLQNKHEAAFYSHVVVNDRAKHVADIFSELLLPLGIQKDYAYYSFPQRAMEHDRVLALTQSGRREDYICLHAGTSENFLGKRWSSSKWAELADILIERTGLKIILTGSSTESGVTRAIMRRVKAPQAVLDLAGQLDIWELIECLRASYMLVSADTGPVHVAASLDIRMAVLYGPTSPGRFGPRNPGGLVFYKGAACSPCVGVDYTNKNCRHHYSCLDFSPEEIWQGIKERYF